MMWWRKLLFLLLRKYQRAFPYWDWIVYLTGASLKILQQLQHFEHLVSPLAEMTSIITTEYSNKSVVAEIMREVGRKDPKDLVRDNTGTKSFATFLVELSEKVPGVMMSNISVVLCHLEGEVSKSIVYSHQVMKILTVIWLYFFFPLNDASTD